jgi:ferredoxin
MPKVTITTDDKTFDCETGVNFLELCENEDTSILFGCRDGACGACLVKVLEGSENLSPMKDDERDFLETLAAEPNERLACQCQINGDIVVEVAD